MDRASDRTVGVFIAICGIGPWRERLDRLQRDAEAGTRSARQVQQVHAIELLLDRLLLAPDDRAPSPAERRVAALTGELVALHEKLPAAGRARLEAQLAESLRGERNLVPLFHLLRTARLQRSRGFEVTFAGLAEGAPFDLVIRSGGAEAEIACDVMSAEEGRFMHRSAWHRLVDRIDLDLQAWLRAHPGRYLMKLTFPSGLTLPGAEAATLPALHARIGEMLATRRRVDTDEAAVLRLEPLMLAAAQADELGLMPRLRQEFGPEALLAVTASGGGVFVLAGRAGQPNEVAAALRRRMEAIVAARLSGTRPGILAMFIEDTDRLEWRLLRERLELEGEARQFMTNKDARGIVAVTCSSRLELFGLGEPDAAPGGELRFRNPAHPAAKQPELAPAVLSSL